MTALSRGQSGSGIEIIAIFVKSLLLGPHSHPLLEISKKNSTLFLKKIPDTISSMSRPQKPLNAWMIALINVAAICSIKNFPLLAEYGLSIVSLLTLSSLFFFLPVAFVSAELASGWPDRGIYTWVREALGIRWGFLAIWLQWISNVIWYPTVLSFIASTFAYIFNPDLATNSLYVMGTILITFWAVTFINFLGMRVSGWISSITAVFGTIIPIVLIIALSGGWLLTGNPSFLSFSWNNLFFDFTSFGQLVLLSGVLLGLAGMEMSAVHAKDVENPQRNYPKAIFLSTFLILLFSIFGALSIGVVVPLHKIELTSGSMEAFRFLFSAFQISWATPLIAAIMTFGALGMMSTWIVGPSRGLLATAEDGDLPPFFQKKNGKGMPTNVLLLQAVIVSLLSAVFLFMPTVNSSYWALVALAAILYMIMYVLLFVAAIRLRYKKPNVLRIYRVPGKNLGLWILGSMGILGSSFGCVFGFFPPSQFSTGDLFVFEAFMIGSTLIFCAVPLLIHWRRNPSWKRPRDSSLQHEPRGEP